MNLSAAVPAGKTLLSDSSNNELLFLYLATVSADGILISPPAQSRKRKVPCRSTEINARVFPDGQSTDEIGILNREFKL